MPFTLSHTAVVLPLFRWRCLDPLALVVGSMAPDFGYFFHRFALAGSAHSLEGAFTVALPSALLAWFILRALAAFLSAPLPPPFREGIRSFMTARPWSASMIVLVPFSLLLGIATHSFLDAFTHRSGWFVQRLDFLHDPWPVYHVLQHLGSVLGMLVLAILAGRCWKANPGNRPVWEASTKVLALAMTVSLFLAIVPAWNFASRFDGYLLLRAFAFRWVVHSIAMAACAYLLVALGLQIRRCSRSH